MNDSPEQRSSFGSRWQDRSSDATGWSLKVAYTLLVGGILANLMLPFRLLGVAVTSQRLIAAGIIGFCLFLFLDDRIRWLPLTVSQKTFVVAHLVLLGATSLRLLLVADETSPASMLSVLFNLVLFLLVILLLRNVDQRNLESLLRVWLPVTVILVVGSFLLWWLGDMLARPVNELSEFRQGYRLRSGVARNIVNPWAASVVLALPLVWRPLLGGAAGTVWKLVSATAVGAVCLAVALTFSRAALIALLLILIVGFGGFLLEVWRGRRSSSRQALRTVASLAIVAVLVMVLVGGLEAAGLPVSKWVTGRVSPVLEGSDPSVIIRVGILERSWDLARDAPLLGYTAQDLEGERYPENTFLLAMLRHGAFGFVAYVAMLAAVGFELLVKWLRRGDGIDTAWLAWFGGYLLLLGTNDFLYFSMGTVTLATLTCVSSRRGFGVLRRAIPEEVTGGRGSAGRPLAVSAGAINE